MSLRRPETLTTAVASHIRDAIVHGELTPGQRMPEVALAAASFCALARTGSRWSAKA